MSSDATVGRIAFGPHRETSSARHDGHSALRSIDGEIVTFDPHPATALLLELVDADGVCCGLYWAGRENRIVKGPRGVEVTFDVEKARRIPLSMRDVAEQLAEAMNQYTDRTVHDLGRTWHVVESAR
jgi:hypothetical protein